MELDAHESEDLAGARVLAPRGTFDNAAVEDLLEALRRIDVNVPVTVDFHDVREIHDVALVRLARELEGRTAVVLGVTGHHHLRLLRYVGLPVGARSRRPEPAGSRAV